jgi:hypothetical protein
MKDVGRRQFIKPACCWTRLHGPGVFLCYKHHLKALRGCMRRMPAGASMLLDPLARPGSFPMLQTSSQSPKRVHVPRAHRRHHAGAPICTAWRFSYVTNIISKP